MGSLHKSSEAVAEAEDKEEKVLVASHIAEQQWVEGEPFPFVISPPPQASSRRFDVGTLVQAIRRSRPSLESQLLRSGAILLRGYGVESASDFNDVVEAFGFEQFPYVGGAAPRSNVVGRVFTANESPPDQKIPFHHEMAQVPTFPARLFFYCDTEPKEGGETPIVLSHVVYEKMVNEYPQFVNDLEEKGLLYIRVLGTGDDLSSPIGRGWQSSFMTNDKVLAEERAAKAGMRLEWLDGGCVRTISGPLPAIKYDYRHGRKVWFNSMVAAYTGWEDARNKPEKAVMFGDGSPLPADAVLACLEMLNKECVAFSWHQGDILLLDNIMVQHSRRPFKPPRRILASLTK
ncbi:hypothetical protein O6H91_08G096200 [Diphasiastrum complanatum]|uniref:Uncharacterized protein n=1 Tax=Diphasiastrum complanatum TaxID=34168 RepID=A0ACC2CZZ9_DIPCM|nr:hypothetical protein O6H91_08G096200 [Diphasiastrum complanatum]